MKSQAEIMQEVRDHAATLGMTPLELCRAAGVADSTWHRWRAGSYEPQTRTLRMLLEYKPKEKAIPRRGIVQSVKNALGKSVAPLVRRPGE